MYDRVLKIIGLVVALVGCAVLTGWVFDVVLLRSVFPGLPGMVPNTATAFLLSGVALYLLPGRSAKVRRVAQACALLTGALGFLTLLEYMFDIDLRIDRLLLRGEPSGNADSVGRMSPHTAFNFALAGCAFLLADVKAKIGFRLSQVLALIMASVALVALVGYVYGVTSLYGISPQTGMALHTAATFLLLSGGLLLINPRSGLMKLVTSEGMGGVAARRLLAAAIIIPLLLGWFPPPAPTLANPFSGFVLPGAGAGGINIIDNDLQNPTVQQTNIGIQREFARNYVVRADYVHNFGTNFIIGRTIGQVFNPVVGGPDLVKNLESSVKTKYDGLLMSVEKRFAQRFQFRASYTLSKAFNYANDDQIPFSNGPVDPNNLQLEYGPTPNDQRHRFAFAGVFDSPFGFRLAPLLMLASGVPLDILLPDASSRIPTLQRNAGGRLFRTGAELNSFIREVNVSGGIGGQPLPLVGDDARFNDNFSSLDLRVTRPVRLGERVSIEPIVEVFNLFNVTNVLGVSNVNYSGFANVLVRDSNDPTSSGFLRSSSFGRPVTTAGGVFGSGGPRAFQFAARVTF